MAPAPVIAHAQLQAGDRVLFYTDGATEQRTPDGSRLGDMLLEDLVERVSSADVIVAETVRSPVPALLDQIGGQEPDDDATLVLLEWHWPA